MSLSGDIKVGKVGNIIRSSSRKGGEVRDIMLKVFIKCDMVWI